MKKNLFYYLFAVICSVSLFTSCSDDDDEETVNPLIGTVWNLAEYKEGSQVGGNTTFESVPFELIWEAPADVLVMGMPVSFLSPMATSLVSQLAATSMKSLTLEKDGTLSAVMIDENGATESKNSKGVATYTISGNQILLKLDITGIIGLISGGDRSVRDIDMSGIAGLLQSDLIKNGIPVNYVLSDNDSKARFYVTKDLIDKLIPMLETILPLLPDTEDMALIKFILNDIPAAIAKTTKIEASLYVVK